MTEQEKKEKTKRTVKRVWDGSKLVMAIGALTAAVNGYMELSKKSVQLSEQNALLFKALSTKVNGMAEKMAYIEGRIDGLDRSEAEKAVKEKIIERPVRAPASFGTGGGSDESMEGALGVMHDEPEVAAATAPEPVPEKPKAMDKPPKQEQQVDQRQEVQYKAYEQLPNDLEALIQVQQQQQEGI